MMASINPLGERARGNRWWRTAVALAAGCTLGGAALGAGAGGLGWAAAHLAAPAGMAAVAAAAGLAVAAGVVELGGWPVPTVRRQVDEAWLTRYRGWVYGAGFGLQLGAGLATTVTTAAVYACVGLTALLGATGDVAAAVAIGALFGLVRAVPVLAGRGLHDPVRLRRRVGRMAAAAGAARVGAGAALCLLGLSAAAAAGPLG